MKAVGNNALRRAIEMAMQESPERKRQIESMLGKRNWFEVAHFAAKCCQSRSLELKPWQPCPMSAEVYPTVDDFPTRGYVAAHDLLARLLAAGLSRYEPDPMRALAEAEAKAG